MTGEDLIWIFLVTGGKNPLLKDVKWVEIDAYLEKYYIQGLKNKTLMN